MLVLPLVLYAGGWLLMTAAMMLPTRCRCSAASARLVDARPDRRLLVELLIRGLSPRWAGFGIAAHLLDMAVHNVARQSDC